MAYLNKAGLAVLTLALSLTVAGCGDDKAAAPLTAQQEKEVAARLAPPGEVVMASDVAPVAAATAGGAARTGEEIYNTKCMTCHATGAAGAPKLANIEEWAPRIAKGMDVLYASSINGLNGMPPKGLCMDCSDDELKASVDYMVEKSQ